MNPEKSPKSPECRKIRASVVATAVGNIGLAASAAGLITVTFARDEESAARRELVQDLGCEPEWIREDFWRAAAQIEEYYQRKRKNFEVPLDFSRLTAFTARVCRILPEIPYGETRTYAWVAGRIGWPKAARAAGSAVGRNPWPIIVPCHRVVSSGGLGGYDGGLELKIRLMGIEGINTGELSWKQKR